MWVSFPLSCSYPFIYWVRQSLVKSPCGIVGGIPPKENQLLYRDNSTGDGSYKPVAFDAKVRFYLDKGKVVFEYLPTLWNINPETLAKSLSKDDYPAYVSKER